MRTCNFVLVSLAAVGCIVAQEPNNRQKTEPGKLDLTFPRRPVPEKRFLDFTFPATRPLPGKLDFTLRPQRSPTPQERLLRPNRKIRLVENPSPCSIPLLEAPIPMNNGYTIRQSRPRMDRFVPMPNVKVPGPSCAERSGSAFQR